MDKKGWVVRVIHRRLTASSHESDEEYVAVLHYDPYQKGNGTLVTVDDINEAFVFSTLAAAEMCAVYIGGLVERKSIPSKGESQDG